MLEMCEEAPMALWFKLGLFAAVTATVIGLSGLPVLAAQQTPRPPELAPGAQPLDAVERLVVPPPDVANAKAEDAAREGRGEPPRFAMPLAVRVTPATDGTWEALPGDRLLWRLRVASPAALSLNLGFTRYQMPPGGTLWLYTPDYQVLRGPFTAADNEAHGQLWTPILEGQEVVVEVELPASEAAALSLELTSVNHGYRSFSSLEKSGSCNVDVVCPEGDGYDPQIRSVAVYSLGGSTFCTGALINNTAQDLRPFFLTADHCDVNVADAPSLVTYWNFENSTCRVPGSPASGQPGDGQLNQFMTGAVFRAEYAPSDMTLLELDDPMNLAFNPHWAGWDRSGANATRAVAVHHPNTDEKRISFEDDPTTLGFFGGGGAPGQETHVQVIDWDLGTTEPGSSGSPLFDQNGRIIGQLHGGGAACGNNLSDYYGRIFTSWTGGGTNATRLSNWLDPLGSGAMTLDGTNGTLDLAVLPGTQAICAPGNATYAVEIVRGPGFAEQVTLSASGAPPGTTAGFSANPLPNGVIESTLTIGNTAGASPGSYAIQIDAVSATASTEQQVVLTLSTAAPGQPTLTAPANGATQQGPRPTFSWAAAAQALGYTLEIASDSSFADIVYSAEVDGLSHTPTTDLSPDVTYLWRVRGQNSCGEGAPSAPASFTTSLVACDCPADTASEIVYLEQFEAGAGGWTSGGTGAIGDTWGLSTARSSSGASSYHALNPPQVSDQRLVSPPIALPSDSISLTLQFQNYQEIERRAQGGCYDAGLLEVSTDGGQSWAQVENNRLLTDPYDGAVTVGSNPLNARQGWCGDPQDWLSSVVDMNAFGGQTVQVRFRLGSDNTVGREGWYIDDVAVQSCVAGTAPAFTSGAPLGGATGVAYSHTFTASGFPAPSFVVTSGELPAGLALDPATGVLSGTPAVPGDYGPITVTAANGIGLAATQTFTLQVSGTSDLYIPLATRPG
jgi:lysyl endopeptidase